MPYPQDIKDIDDASMYFVSNSDIKYYENSIPDELKPKPELPKPFNDDFLGTYPPNPSLLDRIKSILNRKVF